MTSEKFEEDLARADGTDCCDRGRFDLRQSREGLWGKVEGRSKREREAHRRILWILGSPLASSLKDKR